MLTARQRARVLIDRTLARAGYRLTRRDPETDPPDTPYDPSGPVPSSAEDALRADHPRLRALRQTYASLGWPVTEHSRWNPQVVDTWLDLRHFRGDTPYVWHYRESRRVSRLKYFVFLEYVLRQDARSLVHELGEDGAFGCWRYDFPGYPACSRDLLDSVNELLFLDRHLCLAERSDLRILDIGAGYGRLAHRASQALPGLVDYACIDAVPESTFLCEYYTAFREVAPPVRVVPLPEVHGLATDGFDLAINIHSFSECTLAAIEWWLEQLARLRVPRLFLIPNEPEGFLSTEARGERRDYLPAIRSHGFELVVEERVFSDEAVRDLIGIDDRFCLFERSP